MKQIEHSAIEVEFNSLSESVEKTAKVCTDAVVKGDPAFAKKLWRLKHKTPFEHNTYVCIDNEVNDQVRKVIILAKEAGIHQPAFRITQTGMVIGSFRAWSELKYYKEVNFKDLESSLVEYRGPDARRTFFVTTNIGVAREILRHRDFSFTERSTRYVKEHEFNPTVHSDAMEMSFNSDLSLLKHLKEDSVKRDVYRELLPLCTKTNFYMTGFQDMFPHFIGLRLGAGAHPSAKAVAQSIESLICL